MVRLLYSLLRPELICLKLGQLHIIIYTSSPGLSVGSIRLHLRPLISAPEDRLLIDLTAHCFHVLLWEINHAGNVCMYVCMYVSCADAERPLTHQRRTCFISMETMKGS